MGYLDEWLKRTSSGEKLIIIGAGSLGKLTIDCVLRNNEHKINNIGILDDNPDLHGHSILGVPVIGSVNESVFLSENEDISFVVAIANNEIRRNIVSKYQNLQFKNVISKQATVSPFSEMGQGNIILPGVVIDPDAKIKNHVIVNKSSTVAHDVVLYNFSQVSPGVNFGGFVEVDECTFIGLGAKILPFIKITRHVVIGAGAVVTKNIDKPKTVYVGNPARILEKGNNC